MLKNATLLNLLVLFCSYGLLAQADQPVRVLDDYLKSNHANLGLTTTDVAHYEVSSQLISKHNKLSHLYLQQSHDGIPVYNAILNANILPNGEMLSIGNRFVNDLAQKINTTTPTITSVQAIGAVLSYFRLGGITSLALDQKISEREYIYHKEGIALEPVRVHLMYQPMSDAENVRLVWNVDLYQLDAQHWWQARVDAVTGKLIDYYDQVVHCEFGHANNDNCVEELTHDVHAIRTHKENTNNTPMFGGDGAAYRIFPLTIESPNHGSRELVVNPADAVASPFGWHDTDGVEGPEYTITRGNTVHAYHDIFNLNESSGDEPDGGDLLNFDYPLDLNFGRPYSELDAATTNLFYWNNLMHDLWYQYGFDEASGNFQQTNYSGSPGSSDYVNAEVLDGSGTGNANMATPADGGNPRMQMYLWGGSLPNFDGIQVLSPDEVAGFYSFVLAGFGGSIPSQSPLVSQVVLVDDGVGTASDACQTIVNGNELVGKIAMIDRGSCQFGVKALAAQNEGAIAVIICNNETNEYQGLGPGTDGNQVNIPVIGIELAACNQIKLGLPGLEISLGGPNSSLEVPLPGPGGRDSDFDNGVIAHEYTHGISNRLTGGRLQAGCLGNVEQAGEGWSDWFALAMTTTSANFANERRGIGTYLQFQSTTGSGIRTYPYSRDMSVNPDTYANIENTTSVHRIGSVWCAMIWDMYWNLVDEYGFDDDLYNGTGGNNIAMQLVIDGLKLQPCNPTFIDARDAILAADEANYNGANRCIIWETFARRGLGANASAGGNENFEDSDTCPLAFRVNKTGVATANAGDIITYELEIKNELNNIVSEAVVIDQLPAGTSLVEGSSDCNIMMVDGFLMVELGEASANTTYVCSYQLQTSTSLASYPAFEDNVSNFTNWDEENPFGLDSWQLRANSAFTGAVSFFARNVDIVSDQNLILSEPLFLEGLNPGLQFYHEYLLEDNYDGGVIEISADGGDTWEDVGAENFIENGYNGTLENSNNPLSGRTAFTSSSSGYIRTLVDLTAYAGETVLIRFRLGTDNGGSVEGWHLDDITIFANLRTITNTACTDSNGENLCSSVVTVLNGGVVATETIDQNRSLALFPNPTNDKLTIALPAVLNEQVQISVSSMDGRTLQQQKYNSFLRETLDLNNLPAGVYLLQFRTADSVTTRKVIVE